MKEFLNITEEQLPDGVKFSLKGRVNSVHADELQAVLENAVRSGKINIILNMLWVEYLSSSGIRVIIKGYKDSKKAGGKLGIETPSHNVKNVLGQAVLDELLVK